MAPPVAPRAPPGGAERSSGQPPALGAVLLLAVAGLIAWWRGSEQEYGFGHLCACMPSASEASMTPKGTSAVRFSTWVTTLDSLRNRLAHFACRAS